MNNQEITNYLNSFETLTTHERELLHNKMKIIYLRGQIDGAREFKDLFRRTKEQTKAIISEKMERAYFPEGLE